MILPQCERPRHPGLWHTVPPRSIAVGEEYGHPCAERNAGGIRFVKEGEALGRKWPSGRSAP
ncbi:hypothetical protein CBM2615_B10173 [Cupriavidus taiwanensis]|uniref:Uncharacterized protein n=1 Tax=Cupriavidus taiwanensis TaxID=164546 RepID=A0A976AZL5_9BURK|nr:hypothetical protein CBM2615_B10173 [Cupriavidus taiwanensis]SOZ62193.1 hypothetical protein CBM2614_B10082 [Cupriavidus taiwanensis]SOZ66225.1 hypothetical protein CBM2613_B10174 [Cupriavidus taiwanensis]SPA07479.1 hypothetical protein CBM2625_B10174 [Cupriavidus taiwanensis]